MPVVFRQKASASNSNSKKEKISVQLTSLTKHPHALAQPTDTNKMLGDRLRQFFQFLFLLLFHFIQNRASQMRESDGLVAAAPASDGIKLSLL